MMNLVGSDHGQLYGNIPEFGVKELCKTGKRSKRTADIRGDIELGIPYIGRKNAGHSEATIYWCKTIKPYYKRNEASHKSHCGP
jgi:hypothetical protein